MPIGPVEYLVVAFPGNKFKGEIVPALQELEQSGTVHILDLAFVRKDADGSLLTLELADLADDESAPFDLVDGEVGGLMSQDDLLLAAEMLPENSSAALLVWENTWAARFTQAVRNAGGQVLANERIPHDAVMAALEAASTEICNQA
jgi:hypothetical protein